MKEPLHPQSMETLRQLVKLHGVIKIRKALDTIIETMVEEEKVKRGVSTKRAGRT